MCALRCFGFALMWVVIVVAGFAGLWVVDLLGRVAGFLVLRIGLCLVAFRGCDMDLGFGGLCFWVFWVFWLW